MKKRDFLTFNLNLSKKNLKFLNFEKQSVNKEGFLLDKIREISKAWKYPVYDHKHKAIDIINSLKGVNKSYFLHAASVASPFARRYFGLKLAYERKSINEFGLKFDSSKIEYPFFIFDENFLRLDTIPVSYVFNNYTKSYYVVFDLGFKYFLSIPLVNFFKLTDDIYNHLYLNSFSNFFIDLDINFDYFSSFFGQKYQDKALYCFFYGNFFFRKLRSNFLNLDMFVSTQFSDDFSGNFNICNVSRTLLGSVFSCDPWWSKYLNIKDLDFYFFHYYVKNIYDFSKANLFLKFFNKENFSDNLIILEKLKEYFFFKINKVINLDKKNYSSCIFFEDIFKNFLVWIFKKVGIVSLSKFKLFKFWIKTYTHWFPIFYNSNFFIKIFYGLFFFIFYLCRLNFGKKLASFLKYKKKKYRDFFFSLCFNGKAFEEDMYDFLNRRSFVPKWQSNLVVRNSLFSMGVNDFFLFPLFVKDWNILNSYHKRMVTYKISAFITSIGNLFFFFFKKNYLSVFGKLDNKAFFAVIGNARFFLNFVFFLRHSFNFDKSLDDDEDFLKFKKSVKLVWD